MQPTANGQRTTNPWAPLVFVIITLLMFVVPTFLAPRQPRGLNLPPVKGKTVSQEWNEASSATPFVGPLQADSTPMRPGEVPEWARTDEPDWAPSSEFVSKLQQVILVLLFMTAFIALSLRGIQKYFPGLLRPSGRAAPKSLLHILERQTVSPGIQLCVVEVGGKTLVLGFTEHSINQICELTPEELAKAREGAASEPEEVIPPVKPSEVYGRILRQYLSIIPGVGAKRG